MEQTLIIYDDAGVIFYRAKGSVKIPVGIPYVQVEVPEDKYPGSVDVTDPENPVVVFVDLPKDPIIALTEKSNSLEETVDLILTEIIPSLMA